MWIAVGVEGGKTSGCIDFELFGEIRIVAAADVYSGCVGGELIGDIGIVPADSDGNTLNF